MIDFGVALVPEDVAALGVQEDDPFGNGLDRIAKARAFAPGVGFRLSQRLPAKPPGDAPHPLLKTVGAHQNPSRRLRGTYNSKLRIPFPRGGRRPANRPGAA